MAKPDDTPSIAVFCDFENVALGVRDAKYEKFDIRKVLERLLLKGSIVVKKAYCDWNRYREFKAEMHEASFELIEIPHVRQSGKNSADIRMVVDALDLCYTKSHLDTFVIISGDSDFSPLVSKLRENAKTVIGVGVKGSTSDLLTANCDEFIFYDDLVREQRRRGAQNAARRDGGREPGREAGRDAPRDTAGREPARGGGNGGRGGPGRSGEREPLRVVPSGNPPPAATATGGAESDEDTGVGGPWRRHAPGPRESALPTGETEHGDARQAAPDGADGVEEDAATSTAAGSMAGSPGDPSVGSAEGTSPGEDAGTVRDASADAGQADAPAPRGRARRSRARSAASAGAEADTTAVAASAGRAAATPGGDDASTPDPATSDAADPQADPDAPGPAGDAAAPAPKKRAPRRRKTAAGAAPDDTPPADAPAAPAAAGIDAAGTQGAVPARAETPAAEPEPDLDPEPPRRSDEERRQEALDLAVETVEALITERGADDKIWGSMVKQTLKRRRPGFAESYYGYRSFNELLEDARDRGLLALEHDEKSGGYVIRLL